MSEIVFENCSCCAKLYDVMEKSALNDIGESTSIEQGSSVSDESSGSGVSLSLSIYLFGSKS